MKVIRHYPIHREHTVANHPYKNDHGNYEVHEVTTLDGVVLFNDDQKEELLQCLSAGAYSCKVMVTSKTVVGEAKCEYSYDWSSIQNFKEIINDSKITSFPIASGKYKNFQLYMTPIGEYFMILNTVGMSDVRKILNSNERDYYIAPLDVFN